MHKPKAGDPATEVDLSGYTGTYTIRVTGATTTTEEGGEATADATSRAKLSTSKNGAKVASNPYCEFNLYITSAGKLSLSAIDDAEAVNPSDGVTQKIYVAVNGAQPGGSGYAHRDSSVTVTLSAAVQP